MSFAAVAAAVAAVWRSSWIANEEEWETGRREAMRTTTTTERAKEFVKFCTKLNLNTSIVYNSHSLLVCWELCGPPPPTELLANVFWLENWNKRIEEVHFPTKSYFGWWIPAAQKDTVHFVGG